MSINVGDKVKFLNDVGGGTVTAIVNKRIVKVRTKGDWEIPVMVSELIRVDVIGDEDVVLKYDETDYDEEAPTIIREEIISAPEITISGNVEEDRKMALYFSLVRKDPDDLTGNILNAFLINDTNHFILYNYIVRINNVSTCRETGTLEPDTKVFLETFQRELFRQNFSVTLQFILYKEGIYHPVKPAEKVIDISFTRFFLENTFTENDFFDEDAILVKCAEIEY